VHTLILRDLVYKVIGKIYIYGCITFFYEAKLKKMEKAWPDEMEMAKEENEKRKKEKDEEIIN